MVLVSSYEPYMEGVDQRAKGSIVYTTDTIKVALLSSSHTPDLVNHDFFNDITNEVTGTNYTAGGATLASKAVAKNTSLRRSYWQAANVTWSTATISNVKYALLYKSTGVSSTSPLIALLTFASVVSVSASDLVIVWPTEGIDWTGKP